MKLLDLARCVAKKELTDHLRDRRSVTSALLVPLFGPLIFAVMFTFMARWNREDKVIDLPIVGRENAPSLVAYLERAGVQTRDAPADYEAKVQEGALDAVLLVPPDYGKRFSGGKPAEVKLVIDSSRASAHLGQRRVRSALERYGAVVGAERLIARGVAPDLAAPVRVEDKDLATPEKNAGMVLNMIPLFLVLAAFVGGLNVAIDVTAGERERGSLEPLLLCPVSRLALVLGKWAAAVAASIAAVLVSTAAFYVLVHRVPLQDLGVKARFEGPALLGVLCGVLPLALLTSALQMLIAIYSRSFKEAQTSLSLFMMVPMVPGMILALNPVKTRAWMMLVPVFGQDVLLGEVLRGEPLPRAWFALAALASLALAAAALAVTTRLFGKERIIFGR
jgi:sodium transport system permease protein